MRNLFIRTSFVFLIFALLVLGREASSRSTEMLVPDLPPSSAISHNKSFVLNNSTFTAIADLASQNLDGFSHQLTTLSTGRILASAQINIENPGGVAVRGACRLLISNGAGGQMGLTELSVRPAIWYTTHDAKYDLTVPVLGYAIKPAGNYNVVVQCEKLATLGGTTATLDNLIVWEGAR